MAARNPQTSQRRVRTGLRRLLLPLRPRQLTPGRQALHLLRHPLLLLLRQRPPLRPRAPANANRRDGHVKLVQKYLLAGLLVLVPIGITIWVLHFLITSLDQTIFLLPEEIGRAHV